MEGRLRKAMKLYYRGATPVQTVILVVGPTDEGEGKMGNEWTIN